MPIISSAPALGLAAHDHSGRPSGLHLAASAIVFPVASPLPESGVIKTPTSTATRQRCSFCAPRAAFQSLSDRPGNQVQRAKDTLAMRKSSPAWIGTFDGFAYTRRTGPLNPPLRMWRCKARSNISRSSLLVDHSNNQLLHIDVTMAASKVHGTSAAAMATYVLAYVPLL